VRSSCRRPQSIRWPPWVTLPSSPPLARAGRHRHTGPPHRLRGTVHARLRLLKCRNPFVDSNRDDRRAGREPGAPERLRRHREPCQEPAAPVAHRAGPLPRRCVPVGPARIQVYPSPRPVIVMIISSTSLLAAFACHPTPQLRTKQVASSGQIEIDQTAAPRCIAASAKRTHAPAIHHPPACKHPTWEAVVALRRALLDLGAKQPRRDLRGVTGGAPAPR
jgi:hypothetical protein